MSRHPNGPPARPRRPPTRGGWPLAIAGLAVADWRLWAFASAFGLVYWLPPQPGWNWLRPMVRRYGLHVGVVYWAVIKAVPDRVHPTRWGEGAASGVYHLPWFVLAAAAAGL